MLIALASATALFVCGCSTSTQVLGAAPAGELSAPNFANGGPTRVAVTGPTQVGNGGSAYGVPDNSGNAPIGAGSSEYYVQTEQGGSTIDTVQGYMAFMVPTPSTNIQVVFGNAHNSTEIAGPRMTIRAAIENPIDSTPVQLLFNGSATGSLAPGATLTSDKYTGATTLKNQLIYIRYIATRAAGDSTIFPANWIFKTFAGSAILAPYTTTKLSGRFEGVEELRTRTVTDGITTGTTAKSATAAFVPQDAGQSLTVNGTKFLIATYVDADTVTLSGTPPQISSGATFAITPVDKTLGGTIYNNLYTYAYAPYTVLATPLIGTPTPAALVGDSITYGLGDDVTKGGWATRALDIAGSRAGLGTRVHTTIPFVQASMPGDTICNLINYNTLRFSQLNRTKNVLGLMGTNDIPGGSATKVEGCFITLMKEERAAGPLPWYGTVIPRTTSTDRWATTSGQTPSTYEPVRVAFNKWLRDGAPIDSTTLLPVAVGTSSQTAIRAAFYSSTGAVVHLASGPGVHPAGGIFELADTVETSENSGIWTVPNNHTVTDATLNGTTTVTSANGSFLTSDLGKTVWLSDQIAALGTVTKVTSASQITLSASAPISRTGAELTFSVSTTARGNSADGTHPSSLGAALMAEAGAAIVANWTY